MISNRYWVDYLVMGLIIALALFLRCYWQYQYVFMGNQVIFREADPYLHMRLAEVIASNYPHIMSWDHYALYPNGAPTYPPVLAFIIASIAWVIGLGNPSMYLVDTIGAWFPPVAAAIVAVIVYFLGREVFKSRLTGLVGALIISIMPSEFFHRSLLGFTDHHVLEVLLATLTLLLVTVALNRGIYAWFLGALAALIVYCLNWIGWPLLVSIIGTWAYCYAGYKFVHGKRLWYYFAIPTALVIIGIIFVPWMQEKFLYFLANTFLGFTGTIQEVTPVNLYEYYILYGISGFIAAWGIYLAIKNKLNSLFIVWSLFFMLAMIFEKRWGYYGVIAVGLFAGYAISWAVSKVKKDWREYVLAYCCLAIMISTTMFTLGVAKKPNDITNDWYNACVWLKYNSPDPFNNTKAYYSNDPGTPAYSVLSWWDYGHWIIQVGHRVPICSPTQQVSPYYPFFIATDEDTAVNVIKEANVQYLIIDEDMVGRKFYAIQKHVTGFIDNWYLNMPNTVIYKIYNGQSKYWKPIAVFNTVRIYGRVNE